MRDTVHLIIGILISLLFAFILVYFLGMSTTVSGDSMKPVLVSDQKVLVNRFIYKLSQPKPGDVVIFLPNGNENTHYYMRRVVAVPGDKVLIEDGVLYVNGTPMEYTFSDEMVPEAIVIDGLDGRSFAEFRLTVDSVYRGSEWRDTCISEIEIY